MEYYPPCVSVSLCLCVKTISMLPSFTFPYEARAAGYTPYLERKKYSYIARAASANNGCGSNRQQRCCTR